MKFQSAVRNQLNFQLKTSGNSVGRPPVQCNPKVALLDERFVLLIVSIPYSTQAGTGSRCPCLLPPLCRTASLVSGKRFASACCAGVAGDEAAGECATSASFAGVAGEKAARVCADIPLGVAGVESEGFLGQGQNQRPGEPRQVSGRRQGHRRRRRVTLRRQPSVLKIRFQFKPT